MDIDFRSAYQILGLSLYSTIMVSHDVLQYNILNEVLEKTGIFRSLSNLIFFHSGQKIRMLIL